MSTDLKHSHQRSRFIWSTLILVLLFCLGVFTILEEVLLQRVQRENHERQQQTAATLSFEAIFAVMRTGGTLKDINNTILRLENSLDEYSIRIIRGDYISETIGRYADEIQLIKDPLVAQAFSSGSPAQDVADPDIWRYAYPVKFREECLNCHMTETEISKGGVAAVLLFEHRNRQDQFQLSGFHLTLLGYLAISIPILLYLFYSFVHRDN